MLPSNGILYAIYRHEYNHLLGGDYTQSSKYRVTTQTEDL